MRTIIFDFDGTIADSFATMVKLFEEILPRKQKLTADEIEKLRGQKLSEILKYLKIRGWQIPGLLIKGRQAMTAKIAGVKPFGGLPKVLKQLHEQGHQMYIISTNSPQNINQFLRANGLDSCFEGVYGDVGVFRKAAALKKVIRKEKIPREQVVYIGDEVRDVEAAQKVGLPVISVGWGFNHPDILKEAKPDNLAMTPQDLLKYLKNT